MKSYVISLQFAHLTNRER